MNIGTTAGAMAWRRSMSGKLMMLEMLQLGALEKSATILLRAVKRELNQAGSGRWYRSGTGKGMHQASAPGEPPAPDTRKLQKSAHLEHPRLGLVRVMVDGTAAAILEHGSRKRNLAPRPYMRPALKKSYAAMKLEMKKHGAMGGKIALRTGFGTTPMKLRL
jgi:hypothetical protein